MQVELNSEAVDSIVQSVLIQDYKMLVSDNTRLTAIKEPAPYQLEDYSHNLRYIAAMEALMEYYVGFNWRDQVK